MDRGIWGKLETVPTMATVSAWSSFATGLEPGQHGVFYARQVVPQTYSVCPPDPSRRKGEPFWIRLGRRGYRPNLVNVPMTYSPTARAQETRAYARAEQKRWEAAAQATWDGIEAQRRLVLDALKASPRPDILIAVFTAAETAQRLFWHRLAPEAVDVPAATSDILDHLIQRIYRRLDRVVAELIERTTPDTVVVLSGHGAGPNPGGREMLFDWLQHVGLLSITHPTKPAADRIGPRSIQKRTPIPTPAPVDWSNTRAYSIGTDAIHINLEGREPQGVVPPSQYQSLCQEIIDQLLETVDVTSGAPAVESASMSQWLYPGPFAQRGGDVAIRWTDGVLEGLRPPNSPPVQPPDRRVQTGSNRPYGVLFMKGDGIRAGVQLHGLHIIDIAPTLLHLFHDVVPASMDGQVMEDIFEPAWMAMYPVVEAGRRGFPAVAQRITHPEPAPTEKEEAQLIEERLRGLGYID